MPLPPNSPASLASRCFTLRGHLSVDSLAFSLLAMGYELLLYKATHGPDPGPLQLAFLALGLGSSLAGLAWCLTPGSYYSYPRNRTRVFFAARLYLAISLLITPPLFLPQRLGPEQPLSWSQHLWVQMYAQGWVGANLTLAIFVPLPALPCALLRLAIAAIVPTNAVRVCRVPAVRLGADRTAALLHLLQRMAFIATRPSHSPLGPGTTCQAVTTTVQYLLGLALPACVRAELYMRLSAQRGQGRSSGLWNLHLSTPTRLMVYLGLCKVLVAGLLRVYALGGALPGAA